MSIAVLCTNQMLNTTWFSLSLLVIVFLLTLAIYQMITWLSNWFPSFQVFSLPIHLTEQYQLENYTNYTVLLLKSPSIPGRISPEYSLSFLDFSGLLEIFTMSTQFFLDIIKNKSYFYFEKIKIFKGMNICSNERLLNIIAFLVLK